MRETTTYWYCCLDLWLHLNVRSWTSTMPVCNAFTCASVADFGMFFTNSNLRSRASETIHCNDTDVAHYNFNAYQPIFVIFGRDVAEWVRYWIVICYPTSLTSVSAPVSFFETQCITAAPEQPDNLVLLPRNSCCYSHDAVLARVLAMGLLLRKHQFFFQN